MNAEKIIKKLKDQKKTISTMESCTGGYVANEITNNKGASEILKFSAITYSNEYKIKMGVDEKIIDQYTVYSMETAKEMSKKISDFAHSDYGIGITGKMKQKDENNPYGEDNVVFISIYDKEKDTYYTNKIEVCFSSRKQNKKFITDIVIEMLIDLL